MTIKILVADDHPVVRMGVEGVIARSPGFELVGEAVTGDEALRLTEEIRPDVLVLDINMPGLKAVNVVRQIVHRQLPTRVLIMTSYGDPGIVQAMLRAGATGYLLKDEDPSVISEAVRAVASGEIWFSPLLAPAVEPLSQDGRGLSKREVEIISWLIAGLANKEIGARAGIAERTVEYYITQVFRKLHLASRLELAMWAKEHPTIDV